MIQKTFRDDAMIPTPMKVWRKSEIIKNLLTVTHVLEGLQQDEHQRMFNVFGLQSTKIRD